MSPNIMNQDSPDPILSSLEEDGRKKMLNLKDCRDWSWPHCFSMYLLQIYYQLPHYNFYADGTVLAYYSYKFCVEYQALETSKGVQTGLLHSSATHS